MGSNGFYHILMGSSGFYHILMACNGLYQFIRGISWFYLVLPSFFFPKAELTFVSVLPVSFFDSGRRLFRDVCFLFVNNEENKQTNKPTNQPTNKQTNQKETASFCQLKAAERGVLAADQQIDRPRKKKKIKTKRKNVQLWFAVFFFVFDRTAFGILLAT